MDSLPTRPKEGKKMNPIGPKVSELTIGGGVAKSLFFFALFALEIGMKISQNPSLPL